MLQVLADKSIVEENEQALLVALTSHKAPETSVTCIIPYLNPIIHTSMRCLKVSIQNVDSMRIHHKRVLLDCNPLTKEHGLQCLAEESLTLFHDGIRSPPSTRPEALLVRLRELGVGCIGGKGGTERRGRDT